MERGKTRTNEMKVLRLTNVIKRKFQQCLHSITGPINIVLSKAANDLSVFTISEKAPARALSWLKALLVLSHLRLKACTHHM